MATSLNTSLESLYLSSALPDSLQWSTDQNTVRVRLFYQQPAQMMVG